VWVAQSGGDPEPHYEAALADYGELLAANPRHDEAWAGRGITRMNWGAHRHRKGRDPTDHYRAAVADLGEAIAINGAKASHYQHRGTAKLNWGMRIEAAEPAEALDRYREAIADLGAAIERDPTLPMLRWFRGTAWYRSAAVKHARSEDILAECKGAVADLEAAVKAMPSLEAQAASMLETCRKVIAGKDE
jgi:tetratricopeptide (TPR) repeat protein